MSLSLRDPEGVLLKGQDGRFLRFVRSRNAALIQKVLSDPDLLKRSSLVDTKIVDLADSTEALAQDSKFLPWAKQNAYGLTLEHQAIFFPSYPHEWCPEALAKAGQLTLDFADAALERGWGLKDASPFNILFEGTTPVFVDWTSLEQRSTTDPTWLAFGQFIRCFLLPLWLQKNENMPLQACYLSYPAGITPQLAYRITRGWKRFTPSFFSLVTLPVWLGFFCNSRKSEVSLYKKHQAAPERAHFTLKRTYKFLKDRIKSSSNLGVPRWSAWNGYLKHRSPYKSEQWDMKKATLAKWLEKSKCKSVLDVGCNEGWFSELAASLGARVIAIDNDPEMVRRTWLRSEKAGLDVQALHVDLCRPSPAMGWKNRENYSFLERAHQKFDAVASLAVVHHIALGEQISYGEVFSLFSLLTKSDLFIEFVGPKDMSFEWAAKGREATLWHHEPFLMALQPYFQIIEEKPITGTDRILYWLRKHRTEAQALAAKL